MNRASSRNPPQKKRRARFRIPTPDNLANVALYYLGRFAASEGSLRRVLENRVRRAAMVHPDFAADSAGQEKLREAIGRIIAQHKKSGALNDAAFADMKANSLRRAGRSQRRIAQQLRHKGIAKDLIERALSPEDGEDPESAEKKAALVFARRRKLGPYRKEPSSADQRRKDLAVMGRAGFTYDIVRQVLGEDTDDCD